jgi:hypothetical protein
LKLTCEEPLSNVAFDFNLRRYNKASGATARATAAGLEAERRISGLAAKEASADERERGAAAGAAAAEATLLAAGQWERNANERETTLAARSRDVDEQYAARAKDMVGRCKLTLSHPR